MILDTAYWQETIEKEIPLSRALDFQILEINEAHCVSQASLAANINIHGTAFAGSLYSLCTLTAWTYLNHCLKHKGLNAQVVLAEGNIRYLRPVSSDIKCECQPDDYKDLNALATKVEAANKGKMQLQVIVQSESKNAVVFNGTFAAIPR